MRFIGQGDKFSNGFTGHGLSTKGGKIIHEYEKEATIKNDEILNELIKNGVKINPDDVVFTATDKSGQNVWLENGNNTTGLEHIKKHTNDFIAKHNIQEIHLISHLKNIIIKGTIVSSKEKNLDNGKIGLEKIYLYKGKYYTLGAIGTNGYIVSMYPIEGGK